MTSFNLEKILKIRQKDLQKEDQIINYHYQRVIKKIWREYNNYKDYTYYEVDTMVPSLPIYNSDEITQKLFKKMVDEDFQCKIIYRNRIYFQWKPKIKENVVIEPLLKITYQRIEKEAKDGKDNINYKVPSFLSGKPWYDSSDMAILIARNLNKKGFVTKVTGDTIFISWDQEVCQEENNYKTKEERKEEALEKINYINEQRYVDFINPKKTKSQSSSQRSSQSDSSNSIYERRLKDLKKDVTYLSK